MRRSSLVAAVAAAIALAIWLSAAHARADGPAVDPGVTATRVVLGATAPLTGGDPAAAAVVRGAAAYFQFVNARGGVLGRRVEYRIADAADPALALEATRGLVEGERVFAVVGSAGTDVGVVTREYLNAARLPQLFVGSGATTFGRDSARHPWTIGFPPTLHAEGSIYGRYLARVKPVSRIAVLASADADGRELLVGLRQGSSGSAVRVVASRSVDPAATDVSTEVGALRSSGATVLAVFAGPAVARAALDASGRVGWRPFVLLASPARRVTMRSVTSALSLGYVKDPADRRWADDPGMRLYRTVMARFAPGASARDAGHVEGMAVAYATVETLRRAGQNLTRAGLMAKARTMNSVSNPFLLPGIRVRTGAADGFPVEQAQLQLWSAGAWRPLGGLWVAGAA